MMSLKDRLKSAVLYTLAILNTALFLCTVFAGTSLFSKSLPVFLFVLGLVAGLILTKTKIAKMSALFKTVLIVSAGALSGLIVSLIL